MIAVDSTMLGYGGSPLAFGGPCLFHQSDSCMAFHFSDSSMEWSDLYDESTTPTHNNNNNNSNAIKPSRIQEELEPKYELEYEPEHEPEHEETTTTKKPSNALDFSSSWPCAKHHSKVQMLPAKVPSSATTTSRPKATKSNTKISSSSSTSTKVRFSPTLDVRTFSIVLGDHPWCEDGLALDLGWDYEDSLDIYSNHNNLNNRQHTKQPMVSPRWRLLPHHPRNNAMLSSSSSSSSSANTSPRQRSYGERKRLLLEVGNCSATEIRLRQFQIKILLRVENLQKEQRKKALRRLSHPPPQQQQSQLPTTPNHQQKSHQSSRGDKNKSTVQNNNNNNNNNSIPPPRGGSATKIPSLYAAMA